MTACVIVTLAKQATAVPALLARLAPCSLALRFSSVRLPLAGRALHPFQVHEPCPRPPIPLPPQLRPEPSGLALTRMTPPMTPPLHRLLH